MDLPFSPPPFGTLVIVGLGLLGGSIAAAAKRRGLVRDVVAVARRGGADLEPARAAGLVDRIVQGRTHYCRLNSSPLSDASEWLRYYERFWTERLDDLERALRADAKPKSKRSKRKKP